VTAPLTGSKTLENDLPLCEERGTACGGEVVRENIYIYHIIKTHESSTHRR